MSENRFLLPSFAEINIQQLGICLKTVWQRAIIFMFISK